MKISAKLGPNDRKYYGTSIELSNDSGGTTSFEVWINGLSEDYFPSEREYDELVDGMPYLKDPDDGDLYPYEVCDNHMETAVAKAICDKIVEALNGLEIEVPTYPSKKVEPQ